MGAVQVAPRETGAGDAQLPRHPDGHRLELGVEQVDPGARDRPADRLGPTVVAGPAAPRGHRDRRLGRAVAVVEVGLRLGVETRRQVDRHRLAAGEHGAQVAAVGERVLLQERREHRHGEGRLRDLPVAQETHEIAGLALAARPRQHRRAADQKRPEDLQNRGVEADRRLMDEAVSFVELDLPGEAQPAPQGAVGHHHPLGLPRRSRGVDDVCRMTGQERRWIRRRQGLPGRLDLPQVLDDHLPPDPSAPPPPPPKSESAAARSAWMRRTETPASARMKAWRSTGSDGSTGR